MPGLAAVMVTLLDNPASDTRANTPLLTVVNPLCRLVPDNVHVPVPTLTKLLVALPCRLSAVVPAKVASVFNPPTTHTVDAGASPPSPFSPSMNVAGSPDNSPMG